MRSKAGAKDYRYMPEPDIALTVLTDEMLEEIKREMPMLPREIKAKLINEYGLSEYNAGLISKDSVVTNFFYEVTKHYNNPKKVANWIISEINKKLNEEMQEEINIPLNPKEFAKILSCQDNGTISQMGARTLFAKIWGESNPNVDELIVSLGLKMESNDGELENIIKGVISVNEKAVMDYKSGNKNAFTFFVGQVMKATRGQADAKRVNEILNKLLNE